MTVTETRDTLNIEFNFFVDRILLTINYLSCLKSIFCNFNRKFPQILFDAIEAVQRRLFSNLMHSHMVELPLFSLKPKSRPSK